MMPGGRLLWRKAAVLGSLWAASEIILGSFLKNANVPFAGALLTCIGISILVAGHRLWPERGLLWRAGLVCAAMKSVSPSAVLLSPMIAIFTEALVAEAAVALAGGIAAGYLLAGGLVMSWVLLYKIGRIYILYGPGALEAYARGLEKLRHWLGSPGGPWEPLLLLLAAYFLAGAAAALVGMRASVPGSVLPAAARPVNFFGRKGEAPGPGYRSVYHLALHALVLAALLASGLLPAAAAVGLSAAYGLACAAFYPRCAGLLAKKAVWTGLGAASLLAGWLLGDWAAGLRMAARAFALTLGFAAVAQELMNPRVRALLERAAGKSFFETLEYAFASLPLVIASLPAGRDMLLRPAASLRTIISLAPCLLERERRPVFIITGAPGSGKTALAAALAGLLAAAGRRPAGIIAEGLWEAGSRAGFDVTDLLTGKRVPLCRRGPGGRIRAGNFRFFEEGLALGRNALASENTSAAAAVFLDEAGFLELEGGGWAPQLANMLGENGPPLVLVVRDFLLVKVVARWRIKPAAVWEAGKVRAEDALEGLAPVLETGRQV